MNRRWASDLVWLPFSWSGLIRRTNRSIAQNRGVGLTRPSPLAGSVSGKNHACCMLEPLRVQTVVGSTFSFETIFFCCDDLKDVRYHVRLLLFIPRLLFVQVFERMSTPGLVKNSLPFSQRPWSADFSTSKNYFAKYQFMYGFF